MDLPGHANDGEERSRADMYRLLAQLWIGAPNRDLMRRLQAAADDAQEQSGHLAAPWRALVGAMRASSVEAAGAEYDALFQGAGKPEVFLYGSYYLTGFLNERPLVLLRADLREFGLTRDTGRGETEDHVAFLFEVMHHLIVGNGAPAYDPDRQRRFFRAHLETWIDQLCDAVDAHPRASTWRAVADLTRSFMRVEVQGFDMLEA